MPKSNNVNKREPKPIKERQNIWNVPNVLSLLRVALVPVFMAAILYLPTMENMLVVGSILSAIIFGLTAFTDMLDGKIARKYHLVTDFGKFIDPLADKFMTFGALLSLLVSDVYASVRPTLVWVAALVMLRELAVTSLRLVAAGKSGIVIAASWWGKVKTATQIVAVEMILLEPVLMHWLPIDGYTAPYCVLSYVGMLAMAVTTVGSGVNYFKAYLPVLRG